MDKGMYDVVVVGAGHSGIACARSLAAGGASVALIEARDRVGGRTESATLGRGTFDLGGQWQGKKHPRLGALIAELDGGPFSTFSTGKKILDLGGERRIYSGAIPTLPPLQLLELHRTLSRIDRMAERINPEDPLLGPEGQRWDGASLEEEKRRWIWSRKVRSLIDASVRVVFGSEPRDLSLLYFLFYVRSGGGLHHLLEIENGAQQTRLRIGMGGLAARAAAKLGDRVHLSSPVRRIHQDKSGVTVFTDSGHFRGKRAVIAAAPALAGRIAYEPMMPAQRDLLVQRMPMGATVKVMALYDRPFWRDDGLSGEAVSDGKPITVAFDNTSDDGKQAALLGFVVGQPARTWSLKSMVERERAVIDAFTRLYGPGAARHEGYHERDWSTEPWSGGCPVGTFGPGSFHAVGRALREPVGRIHFAGTEAAIEHVGYIEGALESGERAAREVLERLNAREEAPEARP